MVTLTAAFGNSHPNAGASPPAPPPYSGGDTPPRPPAILFSFGQRKSTVNESQQNYLKKKYEYLLFENRNLTIRVPSLSLAHELLKLATT